MAPGPRSPAPSSGLSAWATGTNSAAPSATVPRSFLRAFMSSPFVWIALCDLVGEGSDGSATAGQDRVKATRPSSVCSWSSRSSGRSRWSTRSAARPGCPAAAGHARVPAPPRERDRLRPIVSQRSCGRAAPEDRRKGDPGLRLHLRKALGDARDALETRGSGYLLPRAAGRARSARVRAALGTSCEGRSRPIARRRLARLCRSGAERRSQTSRTSSSSSRRRRASRSCAGWRWRSGSRPSSRSDGARSSSPSSRRWSPSGRWRSARARSSCSPCTGRAGRPTLSTSSAKASVCSTKSWASSPERSFASSSCAILRQDPALSVTAAAGAVQLDRRGLGATGRARSTPSARRSARPWSDGQGARTRADRAARGDRRRDRGARRGSTRPPCDAASPCVWQRSRLRRRPRTSSGSRRSRMPTCCCSRPREIPSSACSPWCSREATCDVAAMVEWAAATRTAARSSSPSARSSTTGRRSSSGRGPPPRSIGRLRLIGAADEGARRAAMPAVCSRMRR